MVPAHVRTSAEVAVPGLASGVVAGLVVAGLGALVGLPLGWAAMSALTLGLPMALLGAGYGFLVATARVRLGVFAPAAFYWLLGFPLARLVHETVTPALLGGSLTPPDDLWGFLAYQGLISLGFAVGFVWLNERFMPRWLFRIKDHNPVAHRLFHLYAHEAEQMERTRAGRRSGARSGRRQPDAAATGPARRRS